MNANSFVIKIEKTEIWMTCREPLAPSTDADTVCDGRAVRGFFGNLYRNRPEFHGHLGDKLIYRHPLIQYKVFGGSILVVGLKEGAYLLKAVPGLEYIEIYYKKHSIVKQSTSNIFVPFGLTGEMINYTFITPWIGLNERNYQLYLNLKEKGKDARDMLNKILIGNILSMSKSVNYTVNGLLQVKSKLKEDIGVEVKEGVKLIVFKGEFETNFVIPEFWGIGGKVSLGYGTVKCSKEIKYNETH
ncbi:hypothetical protein AUJ66_02650 [Candidatus Desantisbacteria bacterium CG1_02_38_46]|uniref:Uncharacterized protein n=3 Tax=unclassified Candidatus Desantisiibacteriota TaxID=3106372 RepID=A0A2H9PCB1_9BACT|nr:MAG: hypothetical protein AUJ66_02650 [Candidatus Desantisbacteria bacterium CG1_02_38_46]PIU52096.1 MAG: hypothetical protein COS91_01035 [Candidatus Desantisbacteria bacterium CG07_land_8_20_14_0_80_39_15]PIZ16810.1 MAG: hypothetical protein COY51_01935 [Candidatus Desantisbacteria bacterium CG_4_10_14_0_8_um_filter_39_17]